MKLKLIISIFLLPLISSAALVDQGQVVLEDIPTVEEGASVARTLVNRESLVNVNTIKSIRNGDDSIRHLPVSSMEYYADCDADGDPYWLVIDIGGTNQNIIKGSDYSFTIRDGDHPSNEKVDENYPGRVQGSPAGSPRVQLSGKLRKITFNNPFDQRKLALEKCFLLRHPDAVMWLPSNVVSPHKSHWAKIMVDGVYLIGGFGDRAYIGEIDADLYHSADIIN